MVWTVEKVFDGGIEYLPELMDTPLWVCIDPDRNLHVKSFDKQIAGLYDAICKRENFYQDHTPTAFGDPNYSLYSGIVIGFLQAMEATEEAHDGKIIIRRQPSGRRILVVDKLNRPSWYYEAVKDNRETLSALGF